MNWKKCASVTTGGKPFFYVAPIEDGSIGYRRVVWHRGVLAYAATVDQRYGDRPYLVGYFSTVAEAKRAAEAFDRDDIDDRRASREGVKL